MKNLIFLITTFALSSACAETATEPSIKVFKSRGSIQCEPQSGVPPETMRGELEKAGVAVKSFACGTDGRMYPAVCGAPNGAINIFEIPQDKLSVAQSLGFRSLNDMPDAREIPCD